MIRTLLTLILLISYTGGFAQQFKYYYSNNPKFVKGSDTLLYPFTGGVNAPQLSSTDLNSDGHKDIFMFDRGSNRVLCFIRSGGGYQHAPQYEYRFPYMENWALMRDFNLDGKEDLWTVPIDDRRYSFDTVTNPNLNAIRILVQTTPVFGFKQIGQMVMDTGKSHQGFRNNHDTTFNPPPAPISFSHKDIPSLEDMDGDGDIDVLVFPLEEMSPWYYENYKINPHHISYAKDSTRFILRDKCWGGIFYNGNVPYNNFYIHKAQDDLTNCDYRLYGKTQKKHAGSAGLMLDINGDGVKDYIYGDISFNNLISLTNGRNIHPQHHDSIVTQDSLFPKNTVPFARINFPASYYVDADADGRSDLLVTSNEKEGVKNTNNIWVYKNNGTEAAPVFTYQGNTFFMYNNTIDVGSRSVPVVMDVDADGKKDLLIATGGDFELTYNVSRLILYKNIGSNAFPVFALADSNFLRLTDDTIYEMHPTFGDLTGDGKPDLVAGMTNGQLMYYKNTGSWANPAYSLITRDFAMIDVGDNSAPQLYDLNKDGLLDLIIGNQNGLIQYFKNVGTTTAPQFNAAATIDTLGGIVTRDSFVLVLGYPYRDAYGYATPQICELDGDSTTTELVTGMWNGRVWVYTNVSDTPGKRFLKNDSLFALTAQAERHSLRFGQRSVPCAANLDGDDRLDLMIGNIGGGLNFYASIPSPVDTSIGLGEVVYSTIKVYPNPAKDELYFDTYAMHASMEYEVVDIMGRILLKGNVNHFYATCTVNTQTLLQGLYFLKLQSATQSFVSRFLISR